MLYAKTNGYFQPQFCTARNAVNETGRWYLFSSLVVGETSEEVSWSHVLYTKAIYLGRQVFRSGLGEIIEYYFPRNVVREIKWLQYF